MSIVDDIVKRYDDKVKILNKIAKFFNRNLFFNKNALDYCTINRGFTKKSIDDFLIGYDTDKLLEFIEKEKINFEYLIELGVLSQNKNNSYYDKFSGRIIFPVFDLKGNIIGFSGRIWQSGDNRSKYVNSTLSTVYQKSLSLYGLYQALNDIIESNLVLVVEGNSDVITCHQEDIKITVSSCGTSFTEEHFLILNQFTNRFIFCFDNDESGKKSIERVKKLLSTKKDIKTGYLKIEGPKDLDEFIQNYGSNSLKESILKLESQLRSV